MIEVWMSEVEFDGPEAEAGYLYYGEQSPAHDRTWKGICKLEEAK